jgi:hypothetical protein
MRLAPLLLIVLAVGACGAEPEPAPALQVADTVAAPDQVGEVAEDAASLDAEALDDVAAEDMSDGATVEEISDTGDDTAPADVEDIAAQDVDQPDVPSPDVVDPPPTGVVVTGSVLRLGPPASSERVCAASVCVRGGIR